MVRFHSTYSRALGALQRKNSTHIGYTYIYHLKTHPAPYIYIYIYVGMHSVALGVGGGGGGKAEEWEKKSVLFLKYRSI